LEELWVPGAASEYMGRGGLSGNWLVAHLDGWGVRGDWWLTLGLDKVGVWAEGVGFVHEFGGIGDGHDLGGFNKRVEQE